MNHRVRDTPSETYVFDMTSEAIGKKAFDFDLVLKGRGFSVCLRTGLSPRWGFSASHLFPRLAPWAAFGPDRGHS
jgi:hypothetical protein